MTAIPRMVGYVLIERLVSKGISLAGARTGNRMISVLAGFLACIGVGFLLLAGYLNLGRALDPESASLLVGLGSLGLSAIVLLYLCVAEAVRSHKSKKIQAEIEQILTHFVESIGKEAAGPIEDNPKTAALIAFASGYAAGNRLH